MNAMFERFLQSVPLPGPLANIANFMNQFDQFRTNFQGDPQQQVQSMIQSGKMSQQEFDQLSVLANRIYPMMKGR